jgi:DNA-directed RNA polymerase specialized sigma24 family protein
VPELSDQALHALLRDDPERGWRAFIDQYTPTLVALIARAGVADRDDAGDVYVRVCERLAAERCQRLRRHDPGKGALAAWLTTIVRHVVVDWVRSRAGRRRLFRSIERLEPFDQRVFALFYWEQRRPAEIAEALQMERREPVELADVLDALQRIQGSMTDRHRAELLALVARTRTPAALEDAEATPAAPRAPGNPEQSLQVRELDGLFAAALSALPAGEAAIVRLLFRQGWTRAQVQRALHLDELGTERVNAILRRLRELLAARRVGPREAATPGLRFLEGGTE